MDIEKEKVIMSFIKKLENNSYKDINVNKNEFEEFLNSLLEEK